MTHLQIHLLGAFQVTRNHAPITQFEAATARGLLAYLAMHPHYPQAREELAHLLWASDTGVSGLTNLRSALRRVREALGEDGEPSTPLLRVGRDTVQVDRQAVGASGHPSPSPVGALSLVYGPLGRSGGALPWPFFGPPAH
jgi:DNA-binding SARP family transcriptional activator